MPDRNPTLGKKLAQIKNKKRKKEKKKKRKKEKRK